MKLISCIKEVSNLDMILPKDWVVDYSGKAVDLYYATKMINPFDETALELMLRLKDQTEASTEVITIGNEDILKKALAVGVDHATRLDVKLNKFTVPNETASLLYDVIKEKNANIIFCGKQADNGNHGQTGQILAQKLGWPCFTDVIDVFIEEEFIFIKRLLKEGIETIKIKGNVVLVITQSGNKFLRMATLLDVIAAKSKSIEVVKKDDILNQYNVKSIYIEQPSKKTEYIEMNEQTPRVFSNLIHSFREKV